jgi:bacterioferritin
MPDQKSSQGEQKISRDELANLLNEDLAREYQAIISYVVYSQVLKGAEYMSIADQLELHAHQELKHALIISRQVDYLGKMPSVTPKPVRTSETAKEMLRFDLENENETIRKYRERVRQCEALGEFAMAEQIRQILVDEQDHQIDLATALGEDVPDVSGRGWLSGRSVITATDERAYGSAARARTHEVVTTPRNWHSAREFGLSATEIEAQRHTQFADAAVATIRLKLLKLGAQVRSSVRRLHFALASGCPNKIEFEMAYLYLRRAYNSSWADPGENQVKFHRSERRRAPARTRIAGSRTPPDSQSANLKPQRSDAIEFALFPGKNRRRRLHTAP